MIQFTVHTFPEIHIYTCLLGPDLSIREWYHVV